MNAGRGAALVDGGLKPMAATSPASDCKRERRLAGDTGLWFFVAADMFAFSLFFAIFSLGRAASPAVYAQARQELSPTVGMLNTLILLTSGWCMVMAVHAARAANRARVVTYLAAAMVVGAGFGVTKIYEYTTKVQAGINLLTNEFFSYYFIFTGIHFLHFVVGMVVLAVTLSKARRQGLDAGFQVWIESVGVYWHMVDLLWIVLFAMLYLLK